MKTNNFVKILTLALSLVLIIGAVVGITAAAEDTYTHEMKGATIIHGDKIFIAFAVDVAEADVANVKVEYVWDGEETVHTATYYAEEKVGGTYPAFVTEGIAAYDLGKQLTVTAYYNGEQVGESNTYSVAEYLYTKLYADGVDGTAKECYEALLAYGAASQVHLNAGPALAVDELVCVYSTKEGTKVNGDKTFYFNANATSTTVVPSFEVSAGWVVAGWQVTYLDGTVVEFELGDEIVITGIADLRPTLQQCLDNDPKDHVCDIHGEPMGGECVEGEVIDHKCDYCDKVFSECAEGDVVDHKCDYCGAELADLHADGDDSNHNCDVCNKVLCADEDNDGKCDGCNRMTFEYTVNGGVTLYTLDNLTDKNLVKQDTITTEDTVASYYGYAGRLVDDPTDAANQVLQILVNDGKNNSKTTSAVNASNIKLTPTVVNAGGKVHVVEYDFNLWHFQKGSGTSITDPFSFYAYDAAGNKLGELQHHSTTAKYAGFLSFDSITNEETPDLENNYHFGNNEPRTAYETEPSAYAMFDAQKWYRFRFIWDESTNALYFDVSFDGGATWYTAYSGSRAIEAAFETDAAYLQLEFQQCYQMAFTYYFDNISYTVVDAVPTRPADLGNDSVEFPNGR